MGTSPVGQVGSQTRAVAVLRLFYTLVVHVILFELRGLPMAKYSLTLVEKW